jgi:hypothetical protein
MASLKLFRFPARLAVIGSVCILACSISMAAEIDAAVELAISGDWAKVKDMVKEDPGLTRQEGQSGTLLQWAANDGDVDMCKFLIGNGADVNYLDKFGGTPLHRAAVASGGEKTVEYLLSAGAKPDVVNYECDTPLHKADNAAIAKLLLEKGADVNSIGGRGCTPLWDAVVQTKPDVAEVLLNAGAEMNAENWMGKTPFDIVDPATVKKMTDSKKKVLDLLTAAGAKPGSKIQTSVDAKTMDPKRITEVKPAGEVTGDAMPAGRYWVYFAPKQDGKEWKDWEWKYGGMYNLVGTFRYVVIETGQLGAEPVGTGKAQANQTIVRHMNRDTKLTYAFYLDPVLPVNTAAMNRGRVHEVTPKLETAGDGMAAGKYWIYIAETVKDKDYTQWAWKAYGPFDLRAEKRYSVTHGGSVAEIAQAADKGQTGLRWCNQSLDKWYAFYADTGAAAAGAGKHGGVKRIVDGMGGGDSGGH